MKPAEGMRESDAESMAANSPSDGQVEAAVDPGEDRLGATSPA
jgi:hypothetical protein